MKLWETNATAAVLILLGAICLFFMGGALRADDPDYYNPTFESDETATTITDPIVMKDNMEGTPDWIGADPIESDAWAVYTEDDKLIRILKSSGIRCEYVDEL